MAWYEDSNTFLSIIVLIILYIWGLRRGAIIPIAIMLMLTLFLWGLGIINDYTLFLMVLATIPAVIRIIKRKELD